MKKIQHIMVNDYQSYILLVSNEDIYFSHVEIKKILSNNKSDKGIIMDLFYQNGFSFNRFVEVTFANDGKFESRIINPRDISEDIKNFTKNYFKNNIELLNKSTLPASVKKFVQLIQ